MNKPDNLKMHTVDLAAEKFTKIAELFPNAITETIDENGVVVRAVDPDILQHEINTHVLSGKEERYQFTWPDKHKSILLVNAPIAAALRPCREESVNFNTTENLYIEGDNLDVLKLLRETYLNRAKMIYIDPPYNTGNDFLYEDNFTQNESGFFIRDGQYNDEGNRMARNLDSNGRFHTDWLNMIYPRLRIVRDLLNEEGVIFISIGDNEINNLRKICDEIFGYENFVSCIIWEKRYSPQNAVQWFSEAHDYILIYAKFKNNWQPNLLNRSDEMNARYRNLDNDPRGDWKPENASAQAGHGTPSQFYELVSPNGKIYQPPNGRCWVYTKIKMQEMIEDNRIWFGSDGNSAPAIKRFLSEVKQGVACQTIWKYDDVGHNQEGKKEIKSIFPEAVPFETPKPTRLIKRMLQLCTNCNDNDIILDFFSGSATTAHAVMQLNAEDSGNRKFIMVQIPEVCDENSEAYKAGYKNICEIGKERIRRAGRKIIEESPLTRADLDIGFRVLKLDSSNMKDVYYTPEEHAQMGFDLDGFTDNIKPDRTEEDLLFQVMLELGVPLSAKISHESGVWNVSNGYLIALTRTPFRGQFKRPVAH